MNILESGLIVGAAGDLSLQILNKIGIWNTGLRQYFANQSSLTAIARASILTGFWSYVYGETFKPTLTGFMVFAAALDIVYRKYHKDLGFPDLGEYYQNNSTGATILYNIGAAFLVFSYAEDRSKM